MPVRIKKGRSANDTAFVGQRDAPRTLPGNHHRARGRSSRRRRGPSADPDHQLWVQYHCPWQLRADRGWRRIFMTRKHIDSIVKLNAFLLTTVAVLATGSTGTRAAEINACVNKISGGLFILLTGTCPSNTMLLSWNQVGPQGPAGSPG